MRLGLLLIDSHWSEGGSGGKLVRLVLSSVRVWRFTSEM